MNKGPNATVRLVRRQNHAGTTVSWTTVQREKSSHAYKLSSNVQTACSTDSLNNCPKHSILSFSSFALKIYLWLKMCQHNLPCSIVYAHCLLPGRAFASLYVLLFLEKEAEIGGRVFITWHKIYLKITFFVVKTSIFLPSLYTQRYNYAPICKPIVVYRFYCMALYLSQRRRHVINKLSNNNRVPEIVGHPIICAALHIH